MCRRARNEAPVLSPSVTVGGVAANIAYAASAPGFVGLMQVNVTIPQGAPPGPSEPLVLSIGTTQSPAGVTIAVK